jgi:hypothetical protein
MSLGEDLNQAFEQLTQLMNNPLGSLPQGSMDQLQVSLNQMPNFQNRGQVDQLLNIPQSAKLQSLRARLPELQGRAQAGVKELTETQAALNGEEIPDEPGIDLDALPTEFEREHRPEAEAMDEVVQSLLESVGVGGKPVIRPKEEAPTEAEGPPEPAAGKTKSYMKMLAFFKRHKIWK